MENGRLKMLGKIDHDPIPLTKIKVFRLISIAFAKIFRQELRQKSELKCIK